MSKFFVFIFKIFAIFSLLSSLPFVLHLGETAETKIQETSKSETPTTVQNLFESFIPLYENPTYEFSEFTKGLDTANKSLDIDNLILTPETKWCDYGDTVATYEDIGQCCKHHDACFQNVPPKYKHYGLTNGGLMKRSHCRCDQEFYDCLKKCERNVNVARLVGNTYFNFLKPQCFRKDYPVVGCWNVKNGFCTHYKVDRERERIYQWFDNPVF